MTRATSPIQVSQGVDIKDTSIFEIAVKMPRNLRCGSAHKRGSVGFAPAALCYHKRLIWRRDRLSSIEGTRIRDRFQRFCYMAVIFSW
jgi:hypothetical protein